MKCLEKQSAQRFQDVASLARALGPFGPPDARATADRLARLSPGGAAAAAEPSSEPRVAVRTNRGAQTSATFTSTGASVAGRRRALVPIAMGASALLLGGAIVGGLAAMRGPSAKSTTSAVAGTTAAPSPRGEHDGSRAASAGPGAIDPGAPALPPAGPPAAPPPPESAAGEPTAPASAAVAPAPKNGVAPAVTAHPAAPPSAPPSSAAPALAAPAAAARPQPKPRPAAPAAAPAPRPAATAAFGGRD
ncbi:MAG: hypothetical protein JOZ69_24200 [Myxococcales bacterium]|nr:hypothetical protein [Myxococcales bacterium]